MFIWLLDHGLGRLLIRLLGFDLTDYFSFVDKFDKMPRKAAIKCYFGCHNDGPFHNFPKPEYHNMNKFNMWKLVLSELDKEKGDTYIYNNIRFCYNHFEEFYRCPSKRLTKNAVPTLNIPSTSHAIFPTSQLMTNEPDPQVSSSSNIEIAPLPMLIESSTDKLEMQDKSKGSKKFVKEYNQLKISILKLKQKCKTLQQKLKAATKLAQNDKFLRLLEKLPEHTALFTGMQLNQGSKIPRGRRYSMKEKIMCLTIFKQSQKAYKLLQRLFCLPSKRCILKLLSSISLTPGIDNEVIKHIKNMVKNIPEEKKLCTVIFDEISLTPGLYYQKAIDKIIGFEDFGQKRTNKIADHALVIMIKSLKGKFKQPICFVFCQSTTPYSELKNILINTIKLINHTGLKVIATVCDQSTTNIKVINSLLSDTKEEYLRMQNKEYKSNAFVLDGQKIFPIFDPPHLLKGIRNNLLTKNLKYLHNGENKVAKWEHLKQLFSVDTGEDDIRLVNKLTEAHVNIEKIPKMKVKHAAQVFSQRVSAAMRFTANHNIISKECLETADFLLIMDKLFDSFNSNQYGLTAKMYRSALKTTSPHHKLWDDLLPILKSMEFIQEKLGIKKYIKVPSIKNWVSNIYVIKEMFKILKENYNISSLLTRNLNQDPLENFFCNIRSNGVRNISPTCSQFIGAYKTILINNLMSPHSVGANCEQDDSKLLRPLQCFVKIKEKTTQEPEIATPNINVDGLVNLFTEDNTSQQLSNIVNKEAKRYVAGYIAKKSIYKICKSCNNCRKELLSTMPPRNNDYIFLRDFTKKACNYPSDALCIFLDDVFNITESQLKEEPHINKIKEIIKEKVKIFCNFGFLNCNKHKNQLYEFVIGFTIEVIVHSWCINVNRLLKGKLILDITENNDFTKKQAYKYYLSHCKKRK